MGAGPEHPRENAREYQDVKREFLDLARSKVLPKDAERLNSALGLFEQALQDEGGRNAFQQLQNFVTLARGEPFNASIELFNAVRVIESAARRELQMKRPV